MHSFLYEEAKTNLVLILSLKFPSDADKYGKTWWRLIMEEKWLKNDENHSVVCRKNGENFVGRIFDLFVRERETILVLSTGSRVRKYTPEGHRSWPLCSPSITIWKFSRVRGRWMWIENNDEKRLRSGRLIFRCFLGCRFCFFKPTETFVSERENVAT